MDHQQIENGQIIDRYLMDTLEVDDLETFEAHLIDCFECQQQLQLTRRFIDAMKSLEVEELVLDPPVNRWRPTAIAACCALLLSTAVIARNLYQIEALQLEFAPAAAPTDPIVVLPLIQTRSNHHQPANMIELARQAQQFIIELEGEFQSDATFVIKITGPDGVEIWQQQLSRDYRGILVFGLSSKLLRPGDYAVEVSSPVTSNSPRRYAMRVAQPV